MPTFVIYASILHSIALVFYTTGVWAEHRARRLKPWHAAAFLVGVVADTAGTGLMVELVGGIRINTHSVVGILGLQLMIIHFVWAVSTLLSVVTTYGNSERALNNFHNFSVIVWALWMVAFVTGIYMGVQSI